MKSKKTALGELKLIGLTARTNNKDELTPGKGQIGPLAMKYWNEQIANHFFHRVTAGVTYCIYTEYESDEHGEYTYFIGEAINSFEGQNTEHYKTLTLPASNYKKFTTDAGKMPEVVINAWQEIWQINDKDFEGERAYVADFEIYDERAVNPDEAVVAVFIGVK
jgi:predicted transcriptional regulator YdeE